MGADGPLGLAGALSDSDELKKLIVWQAGTVIPGLDSWEWRWDEYSNLIRYCEYGQTTKHGWEIDHRLASALGGSDDEYANLRPLHWSVNRSLGGLLGGLINQAMK